MTASNGDENMKRVEELKTFLKNNEQIRNSFSGVKDIDEAISKAKSLGFEVSKDDIENDTELSENLLEAIAGGKGNTEENTFFIPEKSGWVLAIDEKTGNIIDSYKKEQKPENGGST